MPSHPNPSGKSWVSPSLMIQKMRDFSEIKTCGSWVLWCEKRPDEGGRSVIVGYAPDGKYHDLTPSGSDVGTRVNEYGGGAWAARSCKFPTKGKQKRPYPEIEIIFSDRKKSGLWWSRMGQDAVCCTNSGGTNQIYADLSFGGAAQDKLVAVRENHPLASTEKPGDITQEIVCFDWTEISEGILHERISIRGFDFFSSPCLSPCGKFLAWIAWQNPHMPWTATQLSVTSLARPEKIFCLSGPVENGRMVSLMEPFWQGQRLYALSDARSKSWTPTAFDIALDEAGTVCWHHDEIPPAPVEIGFPHWVFGQKSYKVFADGGILACGSSGFSLVTGGQQRGRLFYYSPETKIWSSLAEILGPETEFYGDQAATIPEELDVPGSFGAKEDIGNGIFAWLSTPEDAPPALMLGALGGPAKILCRAWSLPDGLVPEDISRPKPISFFIEEDGEKHEIHALFYSPALGPQTEKQPGEKSEKPPLVTLVHGGPTAQAQKALSFKVQWWTSRGFAVLDVNYRGSTGFGRAYRDALNGQWGVRDVQDCCAAVAYVQKKGWVDPRRCVIRGSSAGGLTVLSALACAEGLFVAGTSLYGVTDLRALIAETHRFEAHYLTSLVADPAKEGAEAIYLARSPSQWPEKIQSPILFLHGGEDNVVPLSHASNLAKKLDQSLFHVYPQEGHGFRTPEVVRDSFQRELDFYQDVFADSVFRGKT